MNIMIIINTINYEKKMKECQTINLSVPLLYCQQDIISSQNPECPTKKLCKFHSVIKHLHLYINIYIYIYI